jgi:pyruvate dehydrogenase E2 component (dihydrolipoamide acetyltransferase)
MYGIDTVVPVINPPQAMIVGVGAVRKEVEVGGGGVGEREVGNVAVAVDHRVVDGALAAEWLARLRMVMEEPSYLIL